MPDNEAASTAGDRLKRGERVVISNTVYRVAMVNDCRAHCVALVREHVELRDGRTGVQRAFTATRRQTIDISPCAFVERVTRGPQRKEKRA